MTGRRFNVIGLKRCGNHAIIEWIANHYEGPVVLSNNVLTWPPRQWKATHCFHVPAEDVEGIRSNERVYGPKTPCDARIISVEDPGRSRKFDLLDLMAQDGETSVFLLRSFWNNAASRMRVADYHSARWDDRFPQWWSDLADHCIWLGEDDSEDVFINYDKWCGESRSDLALRLALPIEGYEVAERLSRETAHRNYGGKCGSSFTGFRDNRGDENARWRIMMGDVRFENLVASVDPFVERCRELNLQVFGWTLNHRGECITRS